MAICGAGVVDAGTESDCTADGEAVDEALVDDGVAPTAVSFLSLRPTAGPWRPATLLMSVMVEPFSRSSSDAS